MKRCMDPQYDWMGALSVRTRNVMLYNGIDTLEKAKRLTRTDYLKLPNIGTATSLEIVDWLLAMKEKEN